MYLRLAKRLLLETDKRLLWKLGMNFGLGGMRSVQKYKRRMKKTGEVFPPFLYISIINSCNLRCQGCWVDVSAKQQKIDFQQMNKLIGEAKQMGNRFFGILGGEPFMHSEIMDILAEHPDCYFQVFTNGHFLTDENCKKLRKIGNASPLISIEGNELVSDERRGRADVYSKSMQGIRNAIDNKLFTGVATSLCQSNYEDLLQEEWLDRLIKAGVMYTWFYTYRPVGPKPTNDLCLTREQQREARKFVVNMRCKKPIIIIDAYYDDQGHALCPAATGISHHISPYGDIEPCPIIQFANERIDDERGVREAFAQSEFLQDFRTLAGQATRGCIMLDRPDLMQRLVDKHSARDTTVRQTASAELSAMSARPSQDDPDHELVEKSWFYRLGKKMMFNDFGTYAKSRSLPKVFDDQDELPTVEPVGEATPAMNLPPQGFVAVDDIR